VEHTHSAPTIDEALAVLTDKEGAAKVQPLRQRLTLRALQSDDARMQRELGHTEYDVIDVPLDGEQRAPEESGKG
jgi:hypothetical protein